MTECMHGVVQWAFHQDGVAAVTAETAKENLASEVVLRKTGVCTFETLRNSGLGKSSNQFPRTWKPFVLTMSSWHHEGRMKCLQS